MALAHSPTLRIGPHATCTRGVYGLNLGHIGCHRAWATNGPNSWQQHVYGEKRAKLHREEQQLRVRLQRRGAKDDAQ